MSVREGRAREGGPPALERQLTANLVWFWPRVYRLVTWGTYLNALSPTDDFASALQKLERYRSVYARLRREHCDMQADSASGGSGGEQHPLTQDKDSVWFKRFQNQHLQHDIEIDVARTRQEDAFFVAEDTQRMLERILLAWSVQNPLIGYRQGMNEILAVICCALLGDYDTRAPLTYPTELVALVDKEHMEADAYMLFSHVMRLVVRWYMHNALDESVVQSVKSTAAAVGADEVVWTGGGGCDAVAEEKKTRKRRSTATNALQDTFELIHHQLLRKADPQLYAHFQRADVLPQLYLLRWIRLLFARELELGQLLVLWDALFESEFEAAGGSGGRSHLAFLNWFAVAMVVRLRNQLLGADPLTVLQLLLHQSPPDVVERVVDLARHIEKQPHSFFGPLEDGDNGAEGSFGSRATRRRRNTSLDDGDVARFHYKNCGWLIKRGGGRRKLLGRRSLKRRYFKLHGSILSYYSSPHDSKPLKGSRIDLTQHVVRVLDKEKFNFVLSPIEEEASSDSRHYHLFAASALEMKEWVETLRNAGSAPLKEL